MRRGALKKPTDKNLKKNLRDSSICGGKIIEFF